MNPLEIPELIGKNPQDGRRSIFRAEAHPNWKSVLRVILEKFPEVTGVSFARIKPGALERNSFSPFYLMAFYLDEYAPAFRLRELEITLMRLFQSEVAPIRFAAARAGTETGLFPCTSLMEKVRDLGSILYRRAVRTHSRDLRLAS